MADAGAYGALFLLALLAPAYASDPDIITSGTNTPLLVVLGIGSAAGIGSLLTLTGSAIWEFLYPYAPGTGLDRLRPRRSHFRAELAKGLGHYWSTATPLGGPLGTLELVVSEFVFYSQAPDEIREWVRRRNARFVQALTAAAAIILGVVVGLSGAVSLNGRGLLIDGLFLLLALVSIQFGRQSHHYADLMQRYWFALRVLHPDPLAASDKAVPEADSQAPDPGAA
jgi:hypothetical protein